MPPANGASRRRTTGRIATAAGTVLLVGALGIGTAAAAPARHGAATFGSAATSRPAGAWGRTTPAGAARYHFGVSRQWPVSTYGQIALDFALAQVGKPYLWGGAGPAAYDCSGLAMAAWAAAGVSLTHYTGTQVHQGTPVARADLRPGDLVFFGTATNVYHVGLYVSADQGGEMVDAPHTGAFVRVEPIWWADFYLAVRPA